MSLIMDQVNSSNPQPHLSDQGRHGAPHHRLTDLSGPHGPPPHTHPKGSKKRTSPNRKGTGPERLPSAWTQPCSPGSLWSTYLFLLLVEVVNDDTDEKVQGEERPKDDENDEVDVHVEVVFPLGLLL